MNNLCIDVKNLNKHFGEHHVVKDFSLQVAKGEIYGFLGPNGSGKTTSIRMMCGLITPDSGEGFCLGMDIFTQREKIKQKIGYMTQYFSMWGNLTIRENLFFIARLYGLDQRKARVAGSKEWPSPPACCMNLFCCFWMNRPLAWIQKRDGSSGKCCISSLTKGSQYW